MCDVCVLFVCYLLFYLDLCLLACFDTCLVCFVAACWLFAGLVEFAVLGFSSCLLFGCFVWFLLFVLFVLISCLLGFVLLMLV